MFDRVIHFNTGRLYQSYGQVVVVGVLPGGTILFNDASRGVCGQLTKVTEDPDNPRSERELRRVVMHEYDHSDWRDQRYGHADDYKAMYELQALSRPIVGEYMDNAQ